MPLGSDTVPSQRSPPFVSATATSLPPENPANTNPPSTTAPTGLRTASAGAARWNTQRRRPSRASSAKSRLSALRTTTRSPATTGAESTSLDTRARHSVAAVGIERDHLALGRADDDQLAVGADAARQLRGYAHAPHLPPARGVEPDDRAVRCRGEDAAGR